MTRWMFISATSYHSLLYPRVKVHIDIRLHEVDNRVPRSTMET